MGRLLAQLLASLHAALFANLGLKVLSLVFAVGLFVYLHRQEDTYDRAFPVGVFVRPPPPAANRELMTNIPPNIYVTLRGSTRSLERLMREPIPPVELDLRDGQKRSVKFEKDMLALPPGVEVIIFDPPTLRLEWQDVIERQIPVQASVTGEPAEGFVVQGQPVVEPKEVVVRGPKRVVEVMQFARLAAFDVTGLTEGTYPRPIAIDAPPPRAEYVGLPSTIVTVTIARRVSESKFKSIPVEVVGIPGAITNPRTVAVTVVGPPEIVHALASDQIVPRADLASVGVDPKVQKHGSVVVPVAVELERADARCQPPTVTVKW